MSNHAFKLTLNGSMDRIAMEVTEALRAEGFGALTGIGPKGDANAMAQVDTGSSGKDTAPEET